MVSEDAGRSVRAALCRGMIEEIREKILPALSDAAARDALEAIARLFTVQIVADEQGEALWREFGPPLSRLAGRRFRPGGGQQALDALRRDLAERTRSGAEQAPELMVLEWRLQRAFAAHRNRLSASEAPARPPGAATSREAVQAYLRGRLAHSPKVRVIGLDELPGGRVKASYRLALEATDELPPVTLLRLDKAKSLLATRTGDEWPLPGNWIFQLMSESLIFVGMVFAWLMPVPFGPRNRVHSCAVTPIVPHRNRRHAKVILEKWLILELTNSSAEQQPHASKK